MKVFTKVLCVIISILAVVLLCGQFVYVYAKNVKVADQEGNVMYFYEQNENNSSVQVNLFHTDLRVVDANSSDVKHLFLAPQWNISCETYWDWSYTSWNLNVPRG